ncbi:hypothetical protein BBAL3_288 [Brevundimonas sp. BAL3]|uniref:hypothetical protein n=1 Tax=Brevundimonas sp. BAL3 TaxID=391600 RepID=UPI00017ED500|nr:hypothetical protein [Brevundimonas sp. BAL3]EDX79131.1 hypothetical protein BBAL3_288 [Brevundimonas sp. BAL3]
MRQRMIGAQHPVPSGPPAVKGPHPGDSAGEAFVREYVRIGRARKVSWANLARQLGRAESDLKAAYRGVFG